MATLRGTDWTIEEVEICVSAYFEHLTLELTGQSFNKAQLYRNLSEQTGRTAKSIEFKFQNISAVLNALSREWMTGLAPLANYQELLSQKVSEHIVRIDDIPLNSRVSRPNEASGFSEAASFYLEAPPELRRRSDEIPEYIAALVRKFDPVERDMRNRALGEAGEQVIFNHEKRFLSLIGRSDLADSVRWIAKEEGDGAGYDVLSFTDRGDKKYIEVKTTVGSERTPFFVSRNEHRFCKHNVDRYNLVRLFNFRKGMRGFELRGDIEQHVRLSTENFRAEFE